MAANFVPVSPMGIAPPLMIAPPLVSPIARVYTVPRYRLRVNDSILRSRALRKARFRKRNDLVYDAQKGNLLIKLPPEILHMICDQLDVPSRCTLALTCKFMFELSKRVETGVTDLPSPVRMHLECKTSHCVYTNHISNRRILLLMLKSWMPRGSTLCWICLKYTKTRLSRWKTTRSVNLIGSNRIRLPALDALNLEGVKCHADCLRSNRLLRHWVRGRAGVSGGFAKRARYYAEGRFRAIEYDAGL